MQSCSAYTALAKVKSRTVLELATVLPAKIFGTACSCNNRSINNRQLTCLNNGKILKLTAKLVTAKLRCKTDQPIQTEQVLTYEQ